MKENEFDEAVETGKNDEILKGITKVAKSVDGVINPYNTIGGREEKVDFNSSEFKAYKTNLPEKTGFWTKFRNILFYEIKVELTPYQQKIEDEINEFLHQKITFEKVKDFLFQEVRFGKKK